MLLLIRYFPNALFLKKRHFVQTKQLFQQLLMLLQLVRLQRVWLELVSTKNDGTAAFTAGAIALLEWADTRDYSIAMYSR